MVSVSGRRVKPTLDTKFHIDYEWWERSDQDLRVSMIAQLLPEQQAYFQDRDAGEESDWVKNLMKNPSVKVRIAQHTFNAAARIVKDKTEEMWVRNRLADKYNERESDGALSEWAQSALVVGLDVRN